MNGRPTIAEQYKKGNDVINYVVYKSKTGLGNDEVLQHKIMGTTETSHITLHPDGIINFRVEQHRNKTHLENAVRTNLIGYLPPISNNVKQFLIKIRGKV